MTEQAAMSIERLSKTYKNGRGVRDINLAINRGDIFGLFGPNGSGKTTLLKLMTGLMTADEGSVRIFGQSISEQFEGAMAHVGCVIETADAYEYMNGYANLKLASRFYRNMASDRIYEVLEMVGLKSYSDEKVSGYSLGMKQRLALAAALLGNPKLILLDEPTNGLDIEGIIDVRNVILRLAREEKITFIISSHMMSEMEMVCSRAGILYNGQLIGEGVIEELLAGGQTMEQVYLSAIQKTREGAAHV
ncbi:Bacitracin transport ATP-binding protein BcrA [Paenibacillus plantiphilus]|uniref:Bacitracin transport ATP-binding protein BcrA n=1 Tax=Paenibacillus plantiphilus TaxID=2905650 RepID=A0ABN8FV66_9BACL|nr:ABC transporter ATP-binding protein [Paenibacillus plantiphilus]CAH1190027.1 Bacitracin transport ATP-binding protein BcrA [Paenibacillus plantiphilus]